MSNLLELSTQYRQAGIACRGRLREHKKRLASGRCGFADELELRQSITMLTAMSRDCLEISSYLRDYYERRDGHGQKGGKTAGK